MIGDETVRFDEFAVPAIVDLISHLLATATEDQMMIRESELDALFTFADMRLRAANAAELDRFALERERVLVAHDLVHAGDPAAAAAQLEVLITEITATSD